MNLRLQIVSKLNLNLVESSSARDQTSMFLEQELRKDIDVLVIAGGVGRWDQAEGFLYKLDAKLASFDNHTKVIYVPGRSEYWDSTLKHVDAELEKNDSPFTPGCWENIIVLNPGITKVKDYRFVSPGPLWPTGFAPQNLDTTKIKDLERVGSRLAALQQAWMEENVKEGDIVITHSVPLYSLPKTGGVGEIVDCDKLVKEKKPRLWIFGRAIGFVHKDVHDTTFICNPKNFWSMSSSPNRGDYVPKLLIEVTDSGKTSNPQQSALSLGY